MLGGKLLAIASVGAFIAAMSTSLVAVSVPVIAKDLHTTPADVSWILSGYLLATSCLLALAGKATDVLGRKRIYLAGFAVFVAGSVLCAVASTLRGLVAARVVQGVGAAMLMAVGPALVTLAVPPEKRARGLGIQLAATYFGLTLGPGLGGLLAGAFGWHAVFGLIALLGTGGSVAAFAFLPADDRRERKTVASLDLGGAVLFGGGLAAFLVALKRGQDHGWLTGLTIGIAAASAIALAFFVRHERAHASPLLPLSLFSKSAFSLGICGAVLLYTVSFMLAFLLPVELQHHAGLGPAQAGAYMTAQPAAMAVTAPLSGIVADRFGPRLPSAAGMIAIAIGLTGVALHVAPPGPMLAVSLAVVGVGAGLYVAPNSALIMGAAPKTQQGVAGAMAATARNVGMTTGIAIAASLHKVIGFRDGILAAAVLAILGGVLAAARPSRTARLERA